MRQGQVRKYLIFLVILAGVVLLSIQLVKLSHRKASHRSEFAVLDRLREGRKDASSRSGLVKEFREQLIREVHDHFHHLPDAPEIDAQHQSQCLMCHSLLPHSKNERIRVMMNMHSDFLNCETCHYKKDRGSLRYVWYDLVPDEMLTSGPKFGTDYDPETGMLLGTENHFSKITPARIVDGTTETLFMPQSHALAKDYLAVKDHLTPGEREMAKKKFHGDIDGKGWACKDCHQKDGVLPFAELGFAPQRVQGLENLEIVGLFEKYEVFHLPNL